MSMHKETYEFVDRGADQHEAVRNVLRRARDEGLRGAALEDAEPMKGGFWRVRIKASEGAAK